MALLSRHKEIRIKKKLKNDSLESDRKENVGRYTKLENTSQTNLLTGRVNVIRQIKYFFD